METRYSKAQIEEAFKVECPYFYDLQKEVNDLDNGIVEVRVRKHNGKISDYVVTVSKRNVVK